MLVSCWQLRALARGSGCFWREWRWWLCSQLFCESSFRGMWLLCRIQLMYSHRPGNGGSTNSSEKCVLESPTWGWFPLTLFQIRIFKFWGWQSLFCSFIGACRSSWLGRLYKSTDVAQCLVHNCWNNCTIYVFHMFIQIRYFYLLFLKYLDRK